MPQVVLSEVLYFGSQSNSGVGPQVVWAISGNVTRPLEHHVRHSPDGFQWGYGGSGPAELARCILLDALPAELADVAEPLYQEFKWCFVAPAGEELWVPGTAIHPWLYEQAIHGAAMQHDGEMQRRLKLWLDTGVAEEPAP